MGLLRTESSRNDERSEMLENIAQYCRALFWRTIRKFGLRSPYYTLKDQKKDKIAPFDEFPSCEMCDSDSLKEVLVTRDKCRIVECNNCGLRFTSPRIKEEIWVNYLKNITPRSIEVTENRLKYGVALSSNVNFAMPNWYEKRMKLENLIINEIQKYLGDEIKRLHDVGCGVGFLIKAAKDRGIRATGNDINGYACKVMNQRLNLKVYNDILGKCPIEKNSLDAIVMKDYIEHTYHPLEDLKVVYNLLSNGGVIWLETFHTDCYAFDKLKGNWNMLFWNHVFHFSTETLIKMIEKAGFKIELVSGDYSTILLKIIARKVESLNTGQRMV